MILSYYLQFGAVLLGLVAGLWLVSLWIRDASIIDSFWGLGFVLADWFYYLRAGSPMEGRWLTMNIIVTLWGVRLSGYIFRRNFGRGEDFRYRKWREEHGARWWWRSFFQVFFLQGILIWVLSTPMLVVQAVKPQPGLTSLDYLGLAVWVIGFFFEAVGDWQLARFKSDTNNKGKVLRSGVWRYTRHPNYFGDAAQWWGYFIIAVGVGGWWTVYSPLLMTWLLVRVSGVAMLEKTLINSKPDYKDYAMRTNAFIPWFPKKESVE